MLSTKRASQILVALAVWAFISAVLSLLIVKIVYTATLPTSLTNITSEINRIQDLTTLKKISVLLADSITAEKEAGWLLVSWGLWFVATWSTIFGIATMFLYRQLITTKATEDSHPKETMLDLALTGKLKLWQAFWGLYVALPMAASFAVYEVLAFLKGIHIIEPTKVADLILTPLSYSAVLVIFWGGAIVTWRCSANTTHKALCYLARVAVVLLTVAPLVQSATLLSHYLVR